MLGLGLSGIGGRSIGNSEDSAVVLILSDIVLDNGMSIFSLCDQMIICSQLPNNYADVLSYKLGGKTLGAGNVFGGIVPTSPGIEITSVAITDGDIVANGIPQFWAAVNSIGLSLLAVGSMAGAVPVLNKQKFALSAFTIREPG